MLLYGHYTLWQSRLRPLPVDVLIIDKGLIHYEVCVQLMIMHRSVLQEEVWVVVDDHVFEHAAELIQRMNEIDPAVAEGGLLFCGIGLLK